VGTGFPKKIVLDQKAASVPLGALGKSRIIGLLPAGGVTGVSCGFTVG